MWKVSTCLYYDIFQYFTFSKLKPTKALHKSSDYMEVLTAGFLFQTSNWMLPVHYIKCLYGILHVPELKLLYINTKKKDSVWSRVHVAGLTGCVARLLSPEQPPCRTAALRCTSPTHAWPSPDPSWINWTTLTFGYKKTPKTRTSLALHISTQEVESWMY